MSEKIRDIEEIRQASRVLGENLFRRQPGSKEFRIKKYGDIMLGVQNEHAAWAEVEGYIEVKRDAGGMPEEVFYTPKFFAEEAQMAGKGQAAVAKHLRKMGERYYGRRRANPESVAMDKLENFEGFLADWLKDEPSVRSWSLRQLKQTEKYADAPSIYRLEAVFEDDRKPVVFVDEAEKIVTMVDNKLSDLYPHTAAEYV